MKFLAESRSPPPPPPYLFFKVPAIPSANTPFDCQQESNKYYRMSFFYQFKNPWCHIAMAPKIVIIVSNILQVFF
jgi:hypothetical protein